MAPFPAADHVKIWRNLTVLASPGGISAGAESQNEKFVEKFYRYGKFRAIGNATPLKYINYPFWHGFCITRKNERFVSKRVVI